MLIRKVLASFVVFLFVILSLPSLIIYALSNTFFDADFYRNGVAEGSYDYVMEISSQTVRNESDAIASLYSKDELKAKLGEVYTLAIHSDILAQVGDQIEYIKTGEVEKASISLKPLRNSLITVANTLTYEVYQDLPTCAVQELRPSGGDFPSCVPRGVPYDVAIAPILNDFELAVYNAIPEELSGLDQIIPAEYFVGIKFWENALFIGLLVLLILIAFLIFKPFSLIVKYESLAFALSGAAGLLLSFGVMELFAMISARTNLEGLAPETLQFVEYLISFVSNEIQRLSLMFVVVGIALIVVMLILRRTIDGNRA